MSTLPLIRAGFRAGGVGSIVMIVGQGLARLGAGIPMLPELFAERIARTFTAPALAGDAGVPSLPARSFLFIILLGCQILIGAAIGVIFALRWGRELPGLRRPWRPWSRAFLCAFLALLVTDLVLLPLAGAGLAGGQTAVGAVGLNLALGPCFLLYGLGLAGSLRLSLLRASTSPAEQSPAEQAAPNVERRRLLGGLGAGLVAVLAAGIVRQATARGGQDAVGRAAWRAVVQDGLPLIRRTGR